VWGTTRCTGVLEAALSNGTMAHALDLDDTYLPVPVHSSACVLPPIFGVAETTLDYKGKVDVSVLMELAKDAAAFANHVGGVIVVGAFEQPDGFPSLRGLPSDELDRVREAYEKAARDWCCPSPLVTCVRLALANGAEFLAVNVEAYAGGPLGAAVR